MEIKEYIEKVNKEEDIVKLKKELNTLHGYMTTWILDDDIMDRVFIVRDRIDVLLKHS